jgi:hypothetical protein
MTTDIREKFGFYYQDFNLLFKTNHIFVSLFNFPFLEHT